MIHAVELDSMPFSFSPLPLPHYRQYSIFNNLHLLFLSFDLSDNVE